MSVLSRIAPLAAMFAAAALAPAAAGERGDWFRSLVRPGTKESCCDIADCMRTDAEWRQDQWWANVRGRWRPIPDDRVLSTPLSLDGEAYVCSADPSNDDSRQVLPVIYCFIPPLMNS
jgi:hypothetical protein